MKHTYEKHQNCDKAHCSICDGGLAYCTICRGGEGSLTTDCCGRPLTADEERRIFTEGSLDFVAGGWVQKPVVQGGTVYVEVIDNNGELLHSNWCVTDDTDRTSEAVIRATGPVDEAAERVRFETAFVAMCAEVRARGLPAQGDNGCPMTRDALCWRTEDGRYGVHAAEQAWWGWRAAVGVPMVLVELEKATA